MPNNLFIDSTFDYASNLPGDDESDDLIERDIQPSNAAKQEE
jgi:hypothetical protein